MKIRGNGSLREIRKGVWEIRFRLGRDPITGDYPRSPARYFHGNKSGAIKARAEYRNELEKGIRVDAEKVTFGEYAEQYHKQREALGTLATGTLKREAYTIGHLNEFLHDVLLREIDATTVRNLLATYEGTPDGRRRLYKTLKPILRQAVNDDLLLRNPCDKVPCPKVAKPEIHYLDYEGAARLMTALDELEASRGTKYRPETERRIFNASRVAAVRLALATGMRRGEVLGLTWGCVDLENQELRVKQQQTKDGKNKPKTERSNRIISLDADTVEYLTAWRALQTEYLLSWSIQRKPETPVITDMVGGYCDPDNFSEWWRDFCKENGFEGLRFHDLRHTQATLLLRGKVDIKTVQGRLGHAKASTTLDMYAAVMPQSDREAAVLMGGILSKRTEPQKLAGVVNL
jgi:integrase